MKKQDSLYTKLINSLIEEISFMKVGDKLPSERKLCIVYNVSRTTVRNAIDYLEYNGYVKRIQGKGTYAVGGADDRYNLSDYYSFTEQTKKLGKNPKSQIIEYHIIRPTPDISDILNIDKNGLVIQFIRLRLADEEPQLLETTYLSYDKFQEITKSLLEEVPLYDIFSKKYNREIHKVKEKFSVANISKKESQLLGIKNITGCLEIKRFSYDKDDNIIEYTKSLASADKFEYQTVYYPKSKSD